ncbi:MAG: hypothetical protein IMW89_05140 [Ktedonobacteraceae bacterium]|nr:hypothetical protein [Ktedonobacteraceae bacterium]
MARVRKAKWGNLTLIFDQHRFWQGYLDGRLFYFLEPPTGVQQQELPVSELLRMVAAPDERGRYQLAGREEYTDLEEGVEEVIGTLMGYLSCWFYPATAADRRRRGAFLSRIPSLDLDEVRRQNEQSAD